MEHTAYDTIVVKIHPASLEEISDFIQMKAQESNLSFKKTWELMLAVDEVCSNIISHGSRGENTNKLQALWADAQEFVTVRLSDDLFPFNPLTVPLEEKDDLEESRNLGGMGTYLIAKMVDEALYDRKDGLNCLTLKKYKKRRPGRKTAAKRKA